MKKLVVTTRKTLYSLEEKEIARPDETKVQKKVRSKKISSAAETLRLLQTLEKRQEQAMTENEEDFDKKSILSLLQELETQKTKR